MGNGAAAREASRVAAPAKRGIENRSAEAALLGRGVTVETIYKLSKKFNKFRATVKFLLDVLLMNFKSYKGNIQITKARVTIRDKKT